MRIPCPTGSGPCSWLSGISRCAGGWLDTMSTGDGKGQTGANGLGALPHLRIEMWGTRKGQTGANGLGVLPHLKIEMWGTRQAQTGANGIRFLPHLRIEMWGTQHPALAASRTGLADTTPLWVPRTARADPHVRERKKPLTDV